MKLSDVDLCNLALDQIGNKATISSLNEGSDTAAICLRNYNHTLRNVLRSGRWKSARVKVSLAQRTDVADPAMAPAVTSASFPLVGGWPPGNTAYSVSDSGPSSFGDAAPGYGNPQMAYAFQLPPDYIRLVRFNDVDSATTSYPFWEVRGDLLWTNQTTAFLEYVRDVSMAGVQGSNPPTIGTLDPDLQECIIKGLAARLSWIFQQSVGQQDKLKKEYDTAVSRALAVDARSEKIALRNPYIDSSWLRSRWHSTNS